jgi:hypothetical protein
MAVIKEDRKARRAKHKFMKNLKTLTQSKKDDARKAVQLAAKKAFNSAQIIIDAGAQPFAVLDSKESIPRGRRPSYDLSHKSTGSLQSQERAMFRGARRGLFENNEFQNCYAPSVSDSSWDHDQGTASESRISCLTGPKQKNTGWKLFRKPKAPSTGFLTSEITQEAWMCGVCTKSFSSLEAAEKHEDYHIREVVEDLGWAEGIDDNENEFMVDDNWSHSELRPRDPPRNESSTRAIVPENQRKPGTLTVSFEPEVMGVSGSKTSNRLRAPPPGPALRSGSLRRMASIDELAGHDILVPTGMKEYVVLADEALVDVCGKAQTMILTRAEIEAELEVEWLAQDKSFYDLIAERAMIRARDGAYSRFRTEGTTILNKVQNKFVDAYQLMKEGDSKGHASMDHYNRKAKGDADTHHLIGHTSKTLYVNVIVKNSISVVSNELERLAKQRWEDAETGAPEGRDVQAQRFQKFRALAQGNLVKLAGLALASDFTPRRIAVQLSNDLYR